MSDNIESLLKLAAEGNQHGFARLLTAIEKAGTNSLKCKELLHPTRAAFRIGITGPPGSGKSTLIGEMLKLLSAKNLKVGVVAVDPTSPISQGAILGDRIRYSEYSLHENFFVRSLGTRGSLGGLSSSAYLMLRAFDVCGFDLVLIETVGVGQVEVEVMNVADYVTVVLVPESGDSIQAMKAGIIEIADLFVVNKKDRSGAEALKHEIEASVALSHNQKMVEVLMTSAVSGDGVDELLKLLLNKQKGFDALSNRFLAQRLKEEAKALMRTNLEFEAQKRVANIHTPDDLARVLI